MNNNYLKKKKITCEEEDTIYDRLLDIIYIKHMYTRFYQSTESSNGTPHFHRSLHYPLKVTLKMN